MSVHISSALMCPGKGLNNVPYFQNAFKRLYALKQKEWIGRMDAKKIGKWYETWPVGVCGLPMRTSSVYL